MAGNLTVGVLALQGAFAKHQEKIEALGITSLQVKKASDLDHCQGLILPGGESTTITCHIQEMGLLFPIKKFAESYPLFGTCAGMILLSREGVLSLLSISVNRNAYGRQSHSFTACLKTQLSNRYLPAPFIRAPRISAIHSPEVKVLADYDGCPVLIQEGWHMAASFHPELTNELTIHHYFVELCKKKQFPPQPLKAIRTKSFQTT